MVWKSPSALFVAKTATPAEGNWAGFWGTDVVVTHIGDLFSAGIVPYRSRLRQREGRRADARDVAETYAPVAISVAYAGQTPVPKPFIMILEWIRTPGGWRIGDRHRSSDPASSCARPLKGRRAAAEDERKGRGIDGGNGADGADDVQVLFDRRCSGQAEVIRHSAEIDRRFTAQTSTAWCCSEACG